MGFILQHLSLLRGGLLAEDAANYQSRDLPPLREERSVRVIALKHCRGVNEIARGAGGKTRLRGSMRLMMSFYGRWCLVLFLVICRSCLFSSLMGSVGILGASD